MDKKMLKKAMKHMKGHQVVGKKAPETKKKRGKY